MDLGRLGKKARNELMRNPKKTAILAVICLVALYFWAPLVQRWLPGGVAKKPPKGAIKAEFAATSQVNAAPVDLETRKSNARADAAFRWDKLVRQREQDPLMSPAAVAEARNPFRPSGKVQDELAARDDEEADDERLAPVAVPIVEVGPQELGFVLKGTLVSSRGGAATINGRTYRQGSQVVASAAPGDQRQTGVTESVVEFTLAEVRKDSVVLTRGEKSFTLEFLKGSLPAGDRIVQNSADSDVDAPNASSEE